jgi:surface protein
MNNLDFVNPINHNTNYREDQQELISRAINISDNPLNALQYIVACLVHEGYSVEFELVFDIPANTEVTLTLPIIETEPKDPLGYYVVWGDSVQHNTNQHTYKQINKSKKYHVRFFGLGIAGFGNKSKYNEGYRKYLTKVISFGNLGHTFTSLKNAFYECNNNFTVPQTLPQSITNISSMFSWCQTFNQPLTMWNTSNITDMSGMFGFCVNFNQSLSMWNTSNVTDMSGMFCCCVNFNQPLSTWNTSNVTDMSNMFYDCTNFNQPLNAWNTSNVSDMSWMFDNCINFNQSLNGWNTSNVTDMDGMFRNCTNFNQPLSTWNTSNLISMDNMFVSCTNFNQPLSTWNTSNVKNMSKIFHSCTNFNQPLSTWNTSNVIYISNMFTDCNILEHNKPIFR